MQKPTLIVITGPTSSGKTDLSIILAKEFNGEIVSADSRQVYRGLDIGTNKITVEEMQGISHHLINVKDPSDQMTLAEYKQLADIAIDDIISRGKIPFLVGGSPLYVRSVVYNYQIPNIAPDEEYRRELEVKDLTELTGMLAGVDPVAYASVDLKNKRRVVRALEVARAGESRSSQAEPRYRALLLAPEWPREELYERIDICLDNRLSMGLIGEVRELLTSSAVTEDRLLSLGLEYRFIVRFLRGAFSESEMIQKLKYEIHDFARRQLVWFRKESQIHWIRTVEEAKSLVREFLKI